VKIDVETMPGETVMSYFEILSWYLLEGLAENINKL
jgi:hypothetical protein